MFSIKRMFEALKKLSVEENIKKDRMYEIICDSLKQAYVMTIFKNELEKPRINVSFNKNGTEVDFFLVKKIVNKKVDIDDLFEISLENAKKIKENAKCNDDIDVKCEDFENKNKLEIFSNNFKFFFKRKIDNEKKTVLYDKYKDKINTIVDAKVEKIDNRGAVIRIGDVSTLLPRKEMIGDEFLFIDQQIKVFLNDTSSEEKHSISVTRANEGFLRKILEEEIYEIYDGTIVIKDIVRIAGKRSKVAVFSTNNEVSATGSCIGKNGIRLAKIVEQLGGNGFDKEKVDIIQYVKNDALYIMNAIRPAEAIGIFFTDNENKKAICVVKNGQFLKAVGLNGINIKLASKLTGYELTVVDEDEAKAKNIEYISKEKIEQEERNKEDEKKKKDFFEHVLAHSQNDDEKIKDESKEDFELENNEIDNKRDNDDKNYNDDKKNYDVEDSYDFLNVETGTSLSDIEAQLSSVKKNKAKNNNVLKNNELNKIEENTKKEKDKDQQYTSKKMDVYTEEELKKIEQENKKESKNNYELEDEDLSEYDDFYDNNDDK